MARNKAVSLLWGISTYYSNSCVVNDLSNMRYFLDDSMVNICCLAAKVKILEILITEALFSDDSALMAHLVNHQQVLSRVQDVQLHNQPQCNSTKVQEKTSRTCKAPSK